MASAEVASAARRASRPARRLRTAAVREALTGYAFIGPNLALFALFMFLPLVLTFVTSAQSSSGFGPTEWAGLENYRTMLGDGRFWRSLANTIAYAAIGVPLMLGGGLGLALLVNRPMRGRAAFRSIFFIPGVISALAAGVIAGWLFDENVGVVNRIAGWFGVDAIPWQSSPFWAATAVIVTTLWIGVGFFMVVYLAGLQGIPRELYDASAVDGATAFEQFRFITLPGLRPATFFLTVYGIITSFQVFDLVYVLTRGGPGDATSVLGTYAYETAFANRERGYGAAIGVVLYALLMIVTLAQWRLNKRREAV
jgi:multiple sugar transport system permease protein